LLTFEKGTQIGFEIALTRDIIRVPKIIEYHKSNIHFILKRDMNRVE